MQIKVETDKRINIYAIWSGKQIILCKGHKKSSHFHNKDWIVLWPSTSRENKMLKKEIPIQSTDFLLSQKGYEYLKTIIDNREVMKNCYIAEVEYVKINGNKEVLWKILRDEGEFVLWDIHSGPLKYFKSKPKHYLAFYRVCKLPEDMFSGITENDIVKDINGDIPGHNSKKLTEKISENIINSVNRFVPIMDDNEYNRRKQKIKNIIEGKYDITSEEKRRKYGQAGESDRHLKLKKYVAKNPESIYLSRECEVIKEYKYPTGDRVDIRMKSPDGKKYVIEIELEGDSKLLIGAKQLIKYRALELAEDRKSLQDDNCIAILVAYSIKGDDFQKFCTQYKIKYYEVNPLSQ